MHRVLRYIALICNPEIHICAIYYLGTVNLLISDKTKAQAFCREITRGGSVYSGVIKIYVVSKSNKSANNYMYLV